MRIISISDELYNKIYENLKGTKFKSVDEYVEFILQNMFDDKRSELEISKEEEELIKKRLRDLGYLD